MAGNAETGFLNRTVTADGASYRYVVYVPFEWTGGKTWPIILFLHGAGERGVEGLDQTNVGLPSAIRKHPDRYPAVIVMPQCHPNRWWPEPAMEAQALAALDTASKEFSGDPARTYLTGLSMGGYGAWDIAAQFPERFAAVAVVCGGVHAPAVARSHASRPSADPYSDLAEKISHVPAWLFHGAADPTVPVDESRLLFEALKRLGADVRYTEYEGVGHNSWDKAYRDPELPKWLFAQRLRALPGSPTVP